MGNFAIIAADSDSIRHYAARHGVNSRIVRVRCDGEKYTIVPAADVPRILRAVEAEMALSDKSMMDEISEGTVWPDSFSLEDIRDNLRRTLERCREGEASDHAALMDPVAMVNSDSVRAARATIRA